MVENKILMITFFCEEEDGVGAQRTITLNRFLKENNFYSTIVGRKYFGAFIQRSFLLWTIAVFIKIVLAKEKKVYVSCGPFQQLFFVSLASFISRKRLIVDFRDPWSLNIKRGYNNSVKVSKIKLEIAEFVEKFTYKICETFIVCTRGMYNEYGKLFSSETKLYLLTNGYDFDPVQPFKKEEMTKLEVACLGKFAEYDMNKAISALQEVKKIAKDNKEIRIHFFGSDKNKNLVVLNKVGLVENSLFYPRMRYDKALDLCAKKCNLAVAVIRDENLDYGTKIFDYIGLNLQVIDNFNEESIFKKEFESFIYNTKDTPTKEEILKYKRENIYKENIDIFL